jgi:hypothetical protein
MSLPVLPEAQPPAALPQLDPIIGGTLALLSHYARMPDLAVSDRIACNLALIARHPQASATLQAMCSGLFADWLGPVEPQDTPRDTGWRDVWPMPTATQ